MRHHESIAPVLLAFVSALLASCATTSSTSPAAEASEPPRSVETTTGDTDSSRSTPSSTPGPVDDRTTCTLDTDCRLTTFIACCSAPLCPGDAAAVAARWLDRAQQVCAVVECSGTDERPTCLNEGVAPSSAVCVERRCVAR